MKVGLYDPHLSTLGGGERYFLVTLEEALRLPDAEVTLFSPERPDPAAWERLGVRVPAESFRWVEGMDAEVSAHSGELDLLFAMVNEVPPPSDARRSVAMIQFPHRSHTGPRARLLRLFGLSRAAQALGSYQRYLCNSEFTRRHLHARLGVDATVLAPPVEIPEDEPSRPEPLILAVGRYFRGHHSKNQHVLLDALDRLDAPGWRLALVGGSGDASYEAELRERARALPAELLVDVPRAERDDLYRRAALFWHAAGYGQDARRHPERLEHFGISTVEAMAHGAVPIVFGAGGPAEVVDDGRNGRHWRSVDELASISAGLIADPAAREALAAAAREDARRYSTERFRAAIRAELLGTVLT